MYTPINEYKLSKERQKDFKEYKKLSEFSIKTIHVQSKIFDDFVESISLSVRDQYRESIPFMGKIMVRF